jgi:C1A family cysteine protease
MALLAISAVACRSTDSAAPNSGSQLASTDGDGDADGISEGGRHYQFAADYRSLPACIGQLQPSAIDWRSKGVVTPVSNEGNCEADWAFAAAGATEGLLAITRGSIASLSVQCILDCDKPRRGCSGSSAAAALAFVEKNGLPKTSDYPYTARLGTCKSEPVAMTIKSMCRPKAGSEEALNAALRIGPVAVVVQDNWASTYHGGIISAAACGPGKGAPHFQAALVVGIGGNGTTQPFYWIVKAYKGTSWGSQGYFYLALGSNACGIADFAVQPRSS